MVLPVIVRAVAALKNVRLALRNTAQIEEVARRRQLGKSLSREAELQELKDRQGQPIGVSVSITFGPRWDAFVAAMRGNMKGLLKNIGDSMAMSAKMSFPSQGRGDVRWDARGTPNFAGIIRDLNAGKNIKRIRFRPRPALMDSGYLQRSIRSRLVSKEVVGVYCVAPYAKLHQKGGPSSVSLSEIGKLNLASVTKRTPSLRRKIGFLFRRPSLSFTVRKRPILFVILEDYTRIQDVIARYVTKKIGAA